MAKTRTIDEEINHRWKQRMQYFENPNYRKWSEFRPTYSRSYGDRIDDFMIISYIVGEEVNRFALNDVKLLDNPRINWQALYQYVDERLGDDRNTLRDELTRVSPFIDDDIFGKVSIVDLLNKYRDELCGYDYDII